MTFPDLESLHYIRVTAVLAGGFELQLPIRFERDKAARLHVTHHQEWRQ